MPNTTRLMRFARSDFTGPESYGGLLRLERVGLLRQRVGLLRQRVGLLRQRSGAGTGSNEPGGRVASSRAQRVGRTGDRGGRHQPEIARRVQPLRGGRREDRWDLVNARVVEPEDVRPRRPRRVAVAAQRA